MFINEFKDLKLNCMTETGPNNCGDPLKEFDPPQNIPESFAILAAILVFYYGLAFYLMLKLQAPKKSKVL